MLEAKEIINVEGVTGRYTREFYSHDMFTPVTTKYSFTTRDLGRYLKNRINKAKDITKLFNNLEKQGYKITTVKTVFGKEPCFNTEIGGIFNGNIHTLNVLWQDKADYIDRGLCVEDGYKQLICTILY